MHVARSLGRVGYINRGYFSFTLPVSELVDMRRTTRLLNVTSAFCWETIQTLSASAVLYGLIKHCFATEACK